MLWYTIINTFSLASPPCHCHGCCHPHRPPHDNCIPGPFFLCQIESCSPLPPIPMADCVFLGGVGRGMTLRPPRQKPIICQLLIVVCLSSIVSDETPMPPPQESTHRDEDAGGGRIETPPPPHAIAAPAPYPTPSVAPPSPPPCTAPVVLSHSGLLHGQ